MKIGIIVGSIRKGRVGRGVGDWVKKVADEHGGAEFSLVDLAEFNVPLLTVDTPPAALQGQYPDPAVAAWAKEIGQYDGFIFVTPEYNHSVPGPFKNAVDNLGVEWMGKAVGFVSYGVDGGVRAVEHWRGSLANLSMIDVRAQVSLSLFNEFGESGFAPADHRAGQLNTLLDQLLDAVEKSGVAQG
ncbi:NADPH-dependent FMN reductase [Nigerium massiliense]|uniref:NADPH-dependent FMN reductase n=1 Tax=Nigerium massiliense TaxID=1522317 RepID=UPI00058ED14D|nr:NAD(P)H-dependent oxidoreductase [Nigerium massiliense]